MPMSTNVKEALRYLYGGIGTACAILFTYYLNGKREDERDLMRKVDYIYIQSITYGIRDSLQTLQLGTLDARLTLHEKETNTAIINIMNSLMASQTQLAEIERQEKEHNNQ